MLLYARNTPKNSTVQKISIQANHITLRTGIVRWDIDFRNFENRVVCLQVKGFCFQKLGHSDSKSRENAPTDKAFKLSHLTFLKNINLFSFCKFALIF